MHRVYVQKSKDFRIPKRQRFGFVMISNSLTYISCARVSMFVVFSYTRLIFFLFKVIFDFRKGLSSGIRREGKARSCSGRSFSTRGAVAAADLTRVFPNVYTRYLKKKNTKTRVRAVKHYRRQTSRKITHLYYAIRRMRGSRAPVESLPCKLCISPSTSRARAR